MASQTFEEISRAYRTIMKTIEEDKIRVINHDRAVKPEIN